MYDDNKVIRIRRYNTGIAHTYGSNIDVLNNRISIPVKTDRLNLDLYENTNGFLTEYSKSIPSEDMAEIFSFLMVNKNLIEEKIKKDSILKNKVNFIKTNIFKIDKNIL